MSSQQRDRAVKKVRKTRISDNSVVLENYDTKTLNTMLERKAKQVGDVVLVNGKPAIIKKRAMRISPFINENIRVRPSMRHEDVKTPRLKRLRAKSPMLRKVKRRRGRKHEQ